MKDFKKINNVIGWVLGIFASIIYIMTSEPTVSLWDCGEFTSTSYKLMVGHPPGAPFFQLFGHIFTLLAGGDRTQVAHMFNMMTALASGFSIMFLFWSIIALIKKFYLKEQEIEKGRMYAVFGAGLIGALAYTFTDSFWFSATEGIVWASASFFTALVFWAMLKWDASADQKNHWRWIILISYLVGCSIGVHLLNLLTIPAMVFIYYFRKHTPTRKGIITTFFISLALTGFIMKGIIPWSLKLSAWFELFFVNTLGMPFNSGTIVYFAVLVGGIIWGLRYTINNKKEIAHVIILSLMFLLIGYSSFMILVVRANANTVINENNPDEAMSLVAYLGREQYGDWPLTYGPYYNAPLDKDKPYKDGTPVYTKSKAKGKYIITDPRKESIPNYDSKFCTIFTRMWNSESDHVKAYKEWGEIKGTPVEYSDDEGKTKTIMKPTFFENLRYFFYYQVGYMYFRYFMWNFAGRQNDIQGQHSLTEGNWMSGIKALDEIRLGPQDGLPDSLANNKGKNKLYMLPLLLGIVGLIFQINRDPKGAWIIFLLFLMTGLAIIVYLNQYAYQPRERDYSYAASFYAFSMWIGIGVLALYDLFVKKLKPIHSALLATLLCLIVPGILAQEEWNDHDRSGRYSCRDFAIDYLQSCAPNAILFTNGDNDTFPLWYAQEVEGVRTDVRVCNLSLLNTDWYIESMKRKAYDSDPVPFGLTVDQIRQGTRDFIYFYPDTNICKPNQYYDLKQLIDFVGSDDPSTKFQTQRGALEYFPTKKFRIPADAATALQTHTIPPYLAKDVAPVEWDMKGKYGVQKDDLMILDLLAHNNWKRPVYFAVSTGPEAYIGLEKYFQLEGLAYRLIPVKTEETPDGETGRIDTDILYDNMMNKFKWGNIMDPRVYLNEDYLRMTMNFRNNFARLAAALVREGKKDKAIKALDRCMEVMPEKTVPFDYFMLPVAESYYAAGDNKKANNIIKRMTEMYSKNLRYYFSFHGNFANAVDYDKQQSLAVMQRIIQIAQLNKQKDLAENAKKIFEVYYGLFK
jgi:hypothetical protein